jgi:hypothetical protein
MAIIRYTLDGGTAPSYISNGGYFKNPSDDSLIGIGSGGGTEMNQSELITYVLSIHASNLFEKNVGDPITRANMTDAEVTTLVNVWCAAST